MAYTSNQGVRIHYRIEGAGTPLVIQHGFSDSPETWYDLGYVDALKQQYQLILVDARGHGASDKPHDPHAYDVQYNATDIVAILDDLNLPQAHFLGYSMGGLIGFALAKYAPTRFFSFIIGGAHASARGNSAAATLWLERLPQGPAVIPPLWDAPISPALHARLLTNDVEALMAYWRKRREMPSLEDVLPTMAMPCLLLAGDADPRYPIIQECVSSMPNATLVTFPGLNHVGTLFRSDLVLPHVLRFLATVNQERSGQR